MFEGFYDVGWSYLNKRLQIKVTMRDLIFKMFNKIHIFLQNKAITHISLYFLRDFQLHIQDYR